MNRVISGICKTSQKEIMALDARRGLLVGFICCRKDKLNRGATLLALLELSIPLPANVVSLQDSFALLMPCLVVRREGMGQSSSNAYTSIIPAPPTANAGIEMKKRSVWVALYFVWLRNAVPWHSRQPPCKQRDDY